MNENTGDLYIMKGKKFKRGLALMLGMMMAANLPASVATPFTMIDSYAYTGAATVKATSLNVRSDAENTHKNGAIIIMATRIIPMARRICPGRTLFPFILIILVIMYPPPASRELNHCNDPDQNQKDHGQSRSYSIIE